VNTYDWWQTHLEGRYFGPGQAGRPLFFYIDDDDEGVEDLCQVVARQAVDWSGPAFDKVFTRVIQWRKGARDEPPPCLPVLAVCVLAATRMTRGAGRGAHAYAGPGDASNCPTAAGR
jgi:hypothetical protein